MNWNGKHKNDILGSIASCRETIAAAKQRGMSSPDAAWLLERVDPEENKAALINLVVPMEQWADALPDKERNNWLIWAMVTHPIEVRQWMGYAPEWSMVPAAVQKDYARALRIMPDGCLPEVYFVPATPRQSDIEKAEPITLDSGTHIKQGIKLASVTYALLPDGWYKVHYPRLPSRSAVNRAIRLFLLGVLVGRTITSTTELMVYEMHGIKSWRMQGNGEIIDGIAKRAGDTLFHLLLEPEMEGKET